MKMPNVVYTVQDRLSFVQQFCSGLSALKIRDKFAADFPHRAVPSLGTIYRTVKKFKETGCVGASNYTDHSLTSWSIVRGASPTSLKIARRFVPYKRYYREPRRICLSDEERRMNFCQAFMDECNANPDLIDTLCTSSECSFSLRQSFGDGQRVGDWTFDRQVSVWTGMVGERLIGPFFVDGSKIRAEQYLVLLRESIVPAIRSLERELGKKIYFQQDGRTSAHKSLNVTDYLNSEFPNRWFGLQTRLAWPARSPDLNPLDYSYWPLLKGHFHRKEVEPTLESLAWSFIEVHHQLTPSQIREATRSLYHRLTYCTVVEGGSFENYL